MAKSTRSKADDTPASSAARPRPDRRRIDSQAKPANGEPVSSLDPAPEILNLSPRQDLDAPDSQDFGGTPIEGDEAPRSESSEHEIRLRAYHLYLDRGAFDGADFDDWLQAEIELKKR